MMFQSVLQYALLHHKGRVDGINKSCLLGFSPKMVGVASQKRKVLNKFIVVYKEKSISRQK